MIWFSRKRSNPVTLTDKLAAPLNEQPSAIAALTSAVGPSLAYHISECKHGGFIVVVDGAVHCARTTLPEAIQAMGKVAADRYGQSATPPEDAPLVAHDDDDPLPVEDDPGLDGPPRVMRPRPMRRPTDPMGRAMAHARHTAQALAVALLIGGAFVWGRA